MKRSPLRRKTPLARQSAKRAVENRFYTKLRKKFLADHPACQIGYWNICTWKSSQVHHRAGRGKLLNVIEYWSAACAQCHDEVHAHPKQARELGFLLDPQKLVTSHE